MDGGSVFSRLRKAQIGSCFIVILATIPSYESKRMHQGLFLCRKAAQRAQS